MTRESSNHRPYLSSIRSKGLSRTKVKWWAIYTNLPVNPIVRLPHPRSGDSQDQETFLAPSADKQTHNHDIECSNHHPYLSTLRSQRFSRSKMKWWSIYTNLKLNAKVGLPHPRNGDSHNQDKFLEPSAEKQNCNHAIESLNHHPSLRTQRSKELSCSKMKWWARYTNLPAYAIVRLPHSWGRDNQGQETFPAPSAVKQIHNHDTESSNYRPYLLSARSKGLSCMKVKWLAI